MTYNYAVYCGQVLMTRTLTNSKAERIAATYGELGRVVEQTYVTGGK